MCPVLLRAGDDMTWTRLDDGWTDRVEFDSLPFDARWHYLALIQFCSRTSRYDGVIPMARALVASDVPDKPGAHLLLSSVGLISLTAETVTVVRIADHVPPPSMRDEARKERRRVEKRRSRQHIAGDHSECLPDRCVKAPIVVDEVSDESDGGSYPSRPVPARPDVSTDTTPDIPEQARAAELWGSSFDN